MELHIDTQEVQGSFVSVSYSRRDISCYNCATLARVQRSLYIGSSDVYCVWFVAVGNQSLTKQMFWHMRNSK